jgi:hypothetical protein
MPWVWIIQAQHNIWLSILFGGGTRKYMGVTKVWWWFTFKPTCLEQTVHIFQCDGPYESFSGLWFICSCSCTETVTAAWSKLLITVNVLVIFWYWQPLSVSWQRPSAVQCITLSISWLCTFFLPKVLLHTTAPPSHLWISVSSMRRNKWNDIIKITIVHVIVHEK